MQREYKLHFHPNFNLSNEEKIKTLTLEEVGECPCCGIATSPTFINGYFIDKNNENVVPVAYILFYCPSCNELYVAKYYIHNCLNSYDQNYKTYPYCTYPAKNKAEEFSDNIKKLSPIFVETYNQACFAEANEDTKGLAGMGYRKAIEFLIKDYLIEIEPDNKDNIIKMSLGKCIDKLDSDIQDLARAATWLGNDETHYFKKHEDYGIDDMKKFIKFLATDIERYYVKLEARKLINKN